MAARPEAVRRTLTDVETFLRCLPGATPDTAGADTAEGRFLIRIGGHQITYRGRAEFTDAEQVVWRATAAQIRGDGKVTATLSFTAEADEGGSTLAVDARFTGAGRVTEFDAEARRQVGERLLERLLQSLAREARPEPVLAAVPEQLPVPPEPAAVVLRRGRPGVPVLVALVGSIGLVLLWMLRRLNVRH